MATARALNSVFRKRHLLCSKVYGTSVLYYVDCPSNSIQYQYSSRSNSVVKSNKNESDSQLQTDFVEVVKENTKSAWYLGVIVAGVGVTCLMFYTIFKELFSSKSPNGVYTNAVARLKKEPAVATALGEPIKAYGEETRRGRRVHVGHTIYMQDGLQHMRMQFYVKGSIQSGTVHLEVKENLSGDYEYKYLFVQLNDYKRTVLMIEDNRSPEISQLY